MKEKPILFSGRMVQALLNTKPGVWPAEPIDPGKAFKSQTRRVIKPQPPHWTWSKYPFEGANLQLPDGGKYVKCPYPVGTRLWVKETTWISECKRYLAQGLERGHTSELDIIDLETGKRYINQHGRGDYALTDGMIASWTNRGRYLRSGRDTEEFDVSFADVDTTVKIILFSGNIIIKSYNAQFRKKLPSIYMPKIATRLWLEVKAVKVERLQDISAEDAIAEGVWVDPPSGVNPSKPDGWDDWSEIRKDSYIEGQARPTYIAQLHHVESLVKAYKKLWDSLNAAPKPVYEGKEIASYVSYPWDDIQEMREYRGKPWVVCGNPWLWVYEFMRV